MKNQKCVLLYTTGLVLSLLCAVGCGRTYRFYEGPKLRPHQVAVLQKVNFLWNALESIDGKAAANAASRIELLPGEHTLILRQGGEGAQSYTETVKQIFLAGHKYSVFANSVGFDNKKGSLTFPRIAIQDITMQK